ncbi:MAG TPA: TetR/AcrR family transcriptional regulator [Alphaproteobacteria bacterium]|nr:TetR/AcrR family transcriptional regulator [Alphaproteobacteria bacterium]
MAEETRRRIVEATHQLHNERSMAGTSMKDIAERAGVSIGTVYHHFPTYDDAVQACGVYTFELMRPPTPAIFKGARSAKERVERLAAELFAFYARFPALARIRYERHLIRALDVSLKQWDALFAGLVREALGADDGPSLAFAGALLDPAVASALAARGLSPSVAAAEIAEAILARRKRTPKIKGGKQPWKRASTKSLRTSTGSPRSSPTSHRRPASPSTSS